MVEVPQTLVEVPQTLVLDLNCRTHDIDNLLVVDGSFFRFCAAMNPALTIIANALRVGDVLIDRMNYHYILSEANVKL